MVITVMTIAHNEQALMPFFIRHYQPITDRIVVYDNGSTDDTADIAQRAGCEVRMIEGSNGELHDGWNTHMKSAAGSMFGGDWVMVPDTDEFLYHPDMRTLLTDYAKHGVTLPRVIGYDMIGEHLLTDGLLTDQIKYGVPDYLYDKSIVYQSRLPIIYRPGAHTFKARTAIFSERADIKLLHYKHAFGREWTRARAAACRKSPEDIAHGWGRDGRDQANIDFFLDQFDRYMADKVQVIA